jgi:hypothetical protein
VEVEDEIQINKKHLKALAIENQFELEILAGRSY